MSEPDAATWLNMNRPVLTKQLGPWNDYIEALEQEFLDREAERDRLRAAIEDALGRNQVTHIHAALRAALQRRPA